MDDTKGKMTRTGEWLHLDGKAVGTMLDHVLAEEIVQRYNEAGKLRDAVEAWQDASGLEKGGDPGGVTPDDLANDLLQRDRELRAVVAERDALLAERKGRPIPFTVIAAGIEKALRERLGFTDDDLKRLATFANSFEWSGRQSSPDLACGDTAAEHSPTVPK